MNFSLELKFFILSHPVTSKHPHKIVQIHMGHPVLPYWWVVLMVMSLLVIGYLAGVMNFFHFSGTPCTIFVEIWLVRW